MNNRISVRVNNELLTIIDKLISLKIVKIRLRQLISY